MNDRPHKKLLVWQRSMELVSSIYELTKQFPRAEIFGLTSQMRRAAVSVPSNLAEGLARSSIPDKMQFLTIARASLSELDTQLEISYRVELIGREQFQSIEHIIIETQKLLNGLIRRMRSR